MKKIFNWLLIAYWTIFPVCLQASEIRHLDQIQHVASTERHIKLMGNNFAQLTPQEWDDVWKELKKAADKAELEITIEGIKAYVSKDARETFQFLTVHNRGTLKIQSESHEYFNFKAPRLKNYSKISITTNAQVNKIQFEQMMSGSLSLRSSLQDKTERLVEWYVTSDQEDINGSFDAEGWISFGSKKSPHQRLRHFNGRVVADEIRFYDVPWIHGEAYSKGDIKSHFSKQPRKVEVSGRLHAGQGVYFRNGNDPEGIYDFVLHKGAELYATKEIAIRTANTIEHNGLMDTTQCYLGGAHHVKGSGVLYAGFLELWAGHVELEKFKLHKHMAYLKATGGVINADCKLAPKRMLILAGQQINGASQEADWKAKDGIAVSGKTLNLSGKMTSDYIHILSESALHTYPMALYAKTLQINAPDISIDTGQRWQANNLFLKITSESGVLALNSLPRPFSRDLDMMRIYLSGGREQFSGQVESNWVDGLRYCFVSQKGKTLRLQGEHRFEQGYVSTDYFYPEDLKIAEKLKVTARKMTKAFGGNWEGRNAESIIKIKSEAAVMDDINLGIANVFLEGDTHYLNKISGTCALHQKARQAHVGDAQLRAYYVNNKETRFSGQQEFGHLVFGPLAKKAYFEGNTRIVGDQTSFLFDGDAFYAEDQDALSFKTRLETFLVKARENIVSRINVAADHEQFSAGQTADIGGTHESIEITIDADHVMLSAKIEAQKQAVIRALSAFDDTPTAAVTGGQVQITAPLVKQYGQLKANKELIIDALNHYISHRAAFAKGENIHVKSGAVHHQGTLEAQKQLVIQALHSFTDTPMAIAQGETTHLTAETIEHFGTLAAHKDLIVQAVRTYRSHQTAAGKGHTVTVVSPDVHHAGAFSVGDTLCIQAGRYEERSSAINTAPHISIEATESAHLRGHNTGTTIAIEAPRGSITPENLTATEMMIRFAEYPNGTDGALTLAHALTNCKSVHIDARNYEHAITRNITWRSNLSLILKKLTIHHALLISKGNLSLEFDEGSIENGGIQADGTLDIKVLKAFTILPGFETRESSECRGDKTTNTYQRICLPSVVHGEKGLTIYLEKGTKLVNIASTLSSGAQTEIIADPSAQQHHLIAENIDIVQEHEEASGWGEFFGDGDTHTQTTRRTVAHPMIKGLVVHMKGGQVTLQSAIVEANQTIVDVDQLWLKATVESVKREYHGQEGYFFVSVTEETKSHKESLQQTQFVNSRGQELESGQVAVKSKQQIHIEHEKGQNLTELSPLMQKLARDGTILDPVQLRSWYASSSNVSLTPIARLAIALVTAIATQGMGSSVFLGEGAATASAFATASLNAAFTTAAAQGTTASLSLAIGDKNWHQNFASRDAICHLILGSVAAGCTAKLGGALIGKGFDPQFLSKFSDNPAHHMIGIGLREMAHVLETLPTDQKWTAKGLLGRCAQAEIETVAKHAAKNIGLQNQSGKLSNFEHKFSHGLTALWAQGAASITERMIGTDNFSAQKFLLATTAAACGAIGAEIVAERYHHTHASRILRNSAHLNKESFQASLAILSKQSADAAKYAMVVMGLLFANEDSLRAFYGAGARAVDNNFVMEALLVASIACAACDAYQAYETARGGTKGYEAAAFSIAKDSAITLATGGVIKVGAKTFKMGMQIARQQVVFAKPIAAVKKNILTLSKCGKDAVDQLDAKVLEIFDRFFGNLYKAVPANGMLKIKGSFSNSVQKQRGPARKGLSVSMSKPQSGVSSTTQNSSSRSTGSNTIGKKIPTQSGIGKPTPNKKIPSWAEGEIPNIKESDRKFADRLCDDTYGKGNYPKGAGSEHSMIQKWAKYRKFVDPT